MDLIRIVWQDSGYHLSDGWQSLKEQLKDFNTDRMTVVTVGLLADEDDEVVVVGLSYSESTDSWFGLQIISKQAITKMEVLHGPDE